MNQKGQGPYSPVATFKTRTSVEFGNLEDLVISEIMYDAIPHGLISGDNFEFIEFSNVGDKPLDLNGVYFTSGIQFHFPADAILEPKQYAVIARNATAFNIRYNFMPIGTFEVYDHH